MTNWTDYRTKFTYPILTAFVIFMIILMVSFLKNLGIKNPAFFYGFAIPFFFYSALTNIQQLSYQKYDQQKLSKPWLSTVGLCTIFMLFASVQLNSYSPFIYYLYGIGGMMLTLACALSIFTIKGRINKIFNPVNNEAYSKMHRSFNGVGAFLLFLYLVFAILKIFFKK